MSGKWSSTRQPVEWKKYVKSKCSRDFQMQKARPDERLKLDQKYRQINALKAIGFRDKSAVLVASKVQRSGRDPNEYNKVSGLLLKQHKRKEKPLFRTFRSNTAIAKIMDLYTIEKRKKNFRSNTAIKKIMDLDRIEKKKKN